MYVNRRVIVYTRLIKLSAPQCIRDNSYASKTYKHKKGVFKILSKEKTYPYIVFLPAEEKDWVLKTVFGSEIPIDILRISVKQGISKKIYQKKLMQTLPYSNKTVIKHLKMLTKRGILKENMEKNESRARSVWVKYYLLSDLGKWFALLLAEKTDLTETEKTEILRNIFKSYVKWVKETSQKLGVSKDVLQEIFDKEMRENVDNQIVKVKKN